MGVALMAHSSAHAQGTVTKVDGSSTVNADGVGWSSTTLQNFYNTSLVQATATAVRTGSAITSFTMVNKGGGYFTPPAVTLSGGGGSGAIGIANLSADGRVDSITVTNGGTGYTGTPTVAIEPPAPGGIGSTVHFNTDITANRILTLNGNRTVGRMNLGDLSSTQTYTLAQGTGGSLFFNNAGNGGGAFLNKFMGGTDTISAPMVLNDQLNVRHTTSRLTLSGAITGNGNVLTSYGNGVLAITGNNTNSNYLLWLWNKGAANANAQVELGATTGNAAGDIIIGNASRGTSGHAVLQLLQGRSNLDQIRNDATVRFDSYTGSGRNNYFKLMGGNETVGRIVDMGSLAVIENREGETVSTGAKLTLAGNGDSYVSGFIRDNTGTNFAQADANGTAGTNALALEKNGTGTLYLSGGNISFTGGMTIGGGTAILRQTTNFRSDVTNNGTLVFDTGTLGLTGIWNFNKTFTTVGSNGRVPIQKNLIISGTGNVEKIGIGILNLSGNVNGSLASVQNFSIGGSLTVRNGTLNLTGLGESGNAGAKIGGKLIAAGDAGLARNINLYGRTTIDGGIDATGLFNAPGSTLRVSGTVFSQGDREVSYYVPGIATINGDIKLNYMDMRLGGGYSVSQSTASAASGNSVTVANSASIVAGMRVTGSSGTIPAGTTVSSINPVTRVITLSNNVTIPGGTALTFHYDSGSTDDGVIKGTVGNMTIVGRPNFVGGASNSGGLYLVNTQYSNNTNRVPDGTAITLKGGVIELMNDGTANAFSEKLGALTLSEGQSQISVDQAASGGSSILTFARLNRQYGTAIEFAGLLQSGAKSDLGVNTRSQIKFDVAPVLDDGIIGGWAWSDNEFVKYTTANGVTRLLASDYYVSNASTNWNSWTADKNVKMATNQTLTLRKAVNSLNMQSPTTATAQGYSLNLGANLLSIETGGLLAGHGNHNITGSTGALVTVGTALNTPAELSVIVGTTTNVSTGAVSAATLTVNTAAIGDFKLSITGATMAAGSLTMSVPTNTANVLKVGMAVSHTNLPAGTTITAIAQNTTSATTITLSSAPKPGTSITAASSTTFLGGSVGLTKSGPGTLVLSNNLENTQSGPTIVNNGTLHLRQNSNLGPAPSAPSAKHLQINGGTLLFGRDNSSTGFTAGQRVPDYNYTISDGNRGVYFGESGGRITVGHVKPAPVVTLNAAGAIVAASPVINVTINNPIVAEGVVELAVNFNSGLAIPEYNTLTLGTAASLNQYKGGIKTEGNFDGIITINGKNYINGLFMEGGRVTLTGQNNFNGTIRLLSGQLNLNAANTYNGSSNFTETITIGTATLNMGHANALGTSGFKVNMADGAQLRLLGTNQKLLSMIGTAGSTISNGSTTNSTHSRLTVDLDVNESYAGRLINGGTNRLELVKTGEGRLALTNNDSDFSGNVSILGGVIDVTSIQFAGGVSALGRGRTGDASEIVIDGGGLSFTLRGQQFTNRSFSMGAGANAATLVANGATQAARIILGARYISDPGTPFEERVISQPVGFVGNGARTLTLSGVNLGDNEFQLQLSDKSASEPTSLLKAGPGNWVLGTEADFSGQVTVQEGILAVAANNVLGTKSIPTTVDLAADTFTGNIPNGVEVTFPELYATKLPRGIFPNTRYYVVNSTATTFKVSLTVGGTAIDLQTPTTGGVPQNVGFVPNIKSIASTVGIASTNTFTGNLPNGTAVVFNTQIPLRAAVTNAAVSAALPSGINSYTTYYVMNSNGTTFQVSTSFTNPTRVTLVSNSVGPIYYMASLPDSSEVNLVGGRLELRNVDYMSREKLTFQGGALAVSANTQARWAGDWDIQANATITVGTDSELILDGNILGNRPITQLGEGTIRLRGETIMPTLLNAPTQELDNNRRSYTVQAGTLILDYSLNNNSKLVDTATLALGGGRRGGTLRLQGGNHEEIVNATSISAGANKIFRDSGSSVIRLNTISRAEGSSLYFDLAGIAKVDNLNINNILGGWAIIRNAVVQASWVLTGSVSRNFSANPVDDVLTIPVSVPPNPTLSNHYLSNGTPVRLTTNGVLPAPLQPNVTYYVTSAGTRTFKLSNSPFGVPLDITDAGTPGTTQHTVATYQPLRTGPATLTFTAHPDNYAGEAGNGKFRIQIVNGTTAGPITSTIVSGSLSSPPILYRINTTSTVNSAEAIKNFVNNDSKVQSYFTASVSGLDTTVDRGSYGPYTLQGGSNDNGSQELGWARNGSNNADGFVQVNGFYEPTNVWAINGNANIVGDIPLLSADSITYTLRYAANAPSTTILEAGATPGSQHTLQTGAILVSPTVGANDSRIMGPGVLGTNNEGNLRNFLIHQHNEEGDLIIGAALVNRAPFKRTGRLTSGNRRILAGIISTANMIPLDTTVPGNEAFVTTVTGSGVPAGTIVVKILDENTVELNNEATSGDGRFEMTFTTDGLSERYFASQQGTNTQNRIMGVKDAAGKISTTDIYIGMPVSGPGIPAGATVDHIYSDADIRLQSNHFFNGMATELTMTPTVGLEKLGAGTLVLSGDNTYSGITFIADGVLRAQKLTDGGVAGSLGTSAGSVAGNLVFNGGTLQYIGENSSTNRFFNITDYAQINVGHEKTTAVFSGNITSSGTIGAADRFEKSGSGTLEMRGDANVNEIKVMEGTLRIQLIDKTPAPDVTSVTNWGQNSLASLRLSGGVFEVRGLPEANAAQTFGGSLYVEEGSSEVRATSVVGFDPMNVTADPLPRTLTLNLMGGRETASVIRSSGGTVRFVESPEIGAGAANIVLNTQLFDRAQVLPWAVYQNTSNEALPGVNEFAAIAIQNAGIVSASSLFIHDLGSFFMNAANWGTDEPGRTLDVSEGGNFEVFFSSGVTLTAGSKTVSISSSLSQDFAKLEVGMSVSGPGLPAGTRVVTLDSTNFLVTLNNAAIANSTSGSYSFLISRTFGGRIGLARPDLADTDPLNIDGRDREVNTIRYYSRNNSNITIDQGSTLKLTAGAILLAANVRGGEKSITGPGNLTGVAVAGQGSDLLIHNYNDAAAFTIGANVVDNVQRSQVTIIGGPPQGFGNTTAGQMTISFGESEYAINLINTLHQGMEVTGPGISAGTFISTLNNTTAFLTKPAQTTVNGGIFSFRSITSFVQTGIGTTILSGNNTYSGKTFVHGGVLRLNSVNAVPGGILSAAPVATSSQIVLKDGVLGLGSDNFSRTLGTANNQIEFKGSGGFAAYGADRTVDFGGEGASKRLRYGNDGFVPDGSSLILGATDATHKVTMLNGIDLGSFSQAVRVNNGPADIEGELAGSLSGLGRLIKFGLGSLRLNAVNTHEGGIEIADGRLVAAAVNNVFGTGTVTLGTSTTNTSKNAAIELSVEGGSHSNNIKVGTVNTRGADWVERGAAGGATGGQGSHSSMAVVNGNPAIAYYDPINKDLKYVRAADTRGNTWFAPVTLDSRGDVGQYPSLTIINGMPAVSYYDVTNGTLSYVRSTDNSGAVWGLPVIADTNPVNSLAVQSDGSIIIGGNFIEFDGTVKTRLARLSSSGVLDSAFNVTVNGEVKSVVVDSSNRIVIAGVFTRVKGSGGSEVETVRNNIARLNSTGTLDTAFNPNVSGSGNRINVVLIQPDGRLLIGGEFATVGGVSRTRFARLEEANGAADPGFTANVADGEVFALVRQSNGSILLGGSFTSVGGSTRNRIARVSSTGTLEAFNPNANGTVRAIAVANVTIDTVQKTYIYLGGLFSTLTGTGSSTSRTRNRLARVDDAGGVDTDYGLEVNAEVRGLYTLASGKVVVTGIFTNLGESVVNYMGRLNLNGTVDSTFLPEPNGEVRTVLESGGKIIVGGVFSNIGGGAQHWVGRLNDNGTYDAGFARKVDDRGQYTSLTTVSNTAAIAYYDAVNADLRYVRGDINGATWSDSMAVVTTGNVGKGLSMKVANLGGNTITKTTDGLVTQGATATNGTPAIAYYDESNQQLRYVLSNNALGSDWSSPVIIHNTQVGNHLSLEIVNGNPAVAYYDSSSKQLHYRRSSNVAGLTHNVPGTGSISLALLQYSRNEQTAPNNAIWGEGTGAGTPQILDASGDVGQFPSLAVVNGQPQTAQGTPAVAYYDVTNGNLKYVRANNATGRPTGVVGDPAPWGASMTVVDTPDNVGRNVTLLMVDGVPATSYEDVTNQRIQFAHIGDASGYSMLAFTGDTTLNGNLTLDGSSFISVDKGKTLTVNGAISGAAGFKLISEGNMLINSSNNAFGTGLNAGDPAPVVVRSGNLVLGSSNALASNMRIDLGDRESGRQVISVKRATTGRSLTALSGRFDSDHNGLFDNAGGPGAFVEVDTTIDGHLYTEDDIGTLILVKDETNPAWNGLYRIIYSSDLQVDGTMNLVRAPEMDEVAEFVYGQQVIVEEGTHAGQSYMLASVVTQLNSSPVYWVRDVVNAKVGLLANVSGVTVSNNIDLNTRAGTSGMSLGAVDSLTGGSVTYSGPITLKDNQAGVSETQSLSLVSNISSGYGVTISGAISEQTGSGANADVLALIKTGTGVVTLRGNNTFHGGVTVNEGTLLVMNTSGSATGTGAVTVNGGGTLGGIGSIAGSVSLTGTGTELATRARLHVGDPTSSSANETLTINGPITVGANSVVEFSLGVNSVTKLVGTSGMHITETGRLVVSMESGYRPAVGTAFDILDLTGALTFAQTGPILLSDYLKLPGIYVWDTSTFLVDGIVKILAETIPVQIVNSPTAVTANPETSVTLSVSVTGSPDFIYQWQRSIGGGAYVNYGNPVRSNQLSNTLTIASIAEADEGFYRVVVSNGEGVYTQTSGSAQVMVNDPPTIVTQPLPVTINPGATATFKVVVSGPGPYTFQWRRGSTNITAGGRITVVSAGDTSTLTITGVTEADEGNNYNVIARNSAAGTTSNFVALLVNDPVTFAVHPQPRIVSAGDYATFTVVANGTAPFTYQWQIKRPGESVFTDIPGATNAVLRLNGVTLEDNNTEVRVIVNNIVNSPLTSNVAILTVGDGTPTFSDPESQTILDRDIKDGIIVDGKPNQNNTLILNFRVGGAQNGRKVVLKRNGKVIREGAVKIGGVTSFVTITQVVNEEDNNALEITLKIDNISTGWGGDYTVEARNVNVKKAIKSPATRIAIVGNPFSVVPAANNAKKATLTAIVGAPKHTKKNPFVISYKWMRLPAGTTEPQDIDPTEVRYTGVTSKTLTIANVTTADSATYVCEVTTSAGGVLLSDGVTFSPRTVVGATQELRVYTGAPQLLAVNFPPAMVGADFFYQIPINPDPSKVPVSYRATGLPPGLKLDTKTGSISGRPTLAKLDGTPYRVSVTVANAFKPDSKTDPTNPPALMVYNVPVGSVGVFAGWIPRHELNENIGGRFDLTTTVKGSFTGKVTLGKTVYPFKGTLTLDPNSGVPGNTSGAKPRGVVTIARKGNPLPTPMKLTFTLDPSVNLLVDSNLLATEIRDNGNGGSSNITLDVPIHGWRNQWSELGRPANAFLGYHTFAMMPPEGSAEDFPQGDSYAYFTVAVDGKLNVVGKTADGQAFTGAQFIGPNGEIVIYHLLYKTTPRGSLVGQVSLNPEDTSRFADNTITVTSGAPLTAPTWYCPPNLAAKNLLYPEGFGPLTMGVTGGAYEDPTREPAVPGEPPYPLILGIETPGPDKAELAFSLSGLNHLGESPNIPYVSSTVTSTDSIDVDAENKVYVPIQPTGSGAPLVNPYGTTLAVNAKAGTFTGRVNLVGPPPVTGGKPPSRTATYQGIIVKTSEGLRGVGYFIMQSRLPVGAEKPNTILKVSNQVLFAPLTPVETPAP